MQEYQTFIVAALTGGISSVATVTAIKVEINWLKNFLFEVRSRLSELEARVAALELKSS